MGNKKTIVIMNKFGELVIFTTDDTAPLDDTNDPFLLVDMPATMMPREGGQLGFQMAFPFSDHDKPLQIRKSGIEKFSEANDQIKKAYEGWVAQVKAQMSGIIVPNAQVAKPTDLRAV